MLRSVHAFGVDGAELVDVRMSWQATADALGLEHAAFFAGWRETFWDDDAFGHDGVIQSTLWALRWSAQRGAAPIFLTGRVSALRRPTVRQLDAIGFGDAPLIMRDDDDDTAAFKARVIAQLEAVGRTVVAFVTDSRREIAAARQALPSLRCFFVRHDDDDGVDDGGELGDDVWTWSVPDDVARPRGAPLLPWALPLSPWMLANIGDAVGASFDDKAVSAPVVSRADVDAIFADVDADVLDRAIDVVVRVGVEQQLNDKEGLARRHDGNVDAAFAGGARFWLPSAPLSASRAQITASRHHDVSAVLGLLARGDDWLLPVHPQGYLGPQATALPARATSSTRTVVVDDTGYAHLRLKCHAPALVLDRHARTLSARDARHAVRMSDALFALDVCHFPEVFAVADVHADAACVVRVDRAWPAGPPGCSTIPAYALWARPRAFDGGRPLIERMLLEAGADVVCDLVIAPLIELVVRLSVELGCASMAHGQNLHVELDASGWPSGRVVLSDLEDLWPHPAMAAALSLPFSLDDAYIAEHAAAEADIANSVQDHFVWRLLHPLLRAVEPLRPRANAILRGAVIRRASVVRRFAPGPLGWFAQSFLDG